MLRAMTVAALLLVGFAVLATWAWQSGGANHPATAALLIAAGGAVLIRFVAAVAALLRRDRL
jgi:hypothetical protein